MKKLIAFLLSTAMLVTALAGCGSETASTPDQGEAAVEEAGDAEATTVTGTDKTMIVTNGEACATCDPVGASAIQEQMLQVNVYDSLVFPTFDGEMIPWVAESWDISEDGLQYTFHLRDDVKFHNGDTLKASDVVFSMNRLMTMAISYSFMWADCFDSCEAIDDTTVVFNLKIPFGPFISSLCRLYIVSEAEVMAHLDDADTTYGDMKDYGANWLLSNDAGSGPYMISDYSAENYVVCDKFADYWGGWEEGAPEQMKIVFTKEETTMKTMMKNNELDISAPYQSTEFYESVDAMEGIDVASYDTGMVQYLMLKVTRAVNGGKGVLYLYGRYQGDMMNFTQAAEKAMEEGIPVKTVLVADDIASMPPEQHRERRGVAGLFLAYKIAGAKAAEGASLDEVAETTQEACDVIRSLGVTLGPCTIPAIGKPNFEIADDEMELGMGIHGEQGIERIKLMSADEVAETLTERIVKDLPFEEGDETVVLLNSLGGTPLEELYIVYRKVSALLADKGIKVYKAYVGRYACSMEMPGLSMTMMKLNEERKRLIDASCDSPFFKQI